MTTLYINSQTKLLCRPVKRVRHLLTALLLVMATIPSHAQFFKQIGMGDGLSNPVVLAIYQDTLQRMWFGTNEGVNIYDGNDMVQSKSYGVQQVLLPGGGMEQQPIFNGIVNKIVGNSKDDVFLLSSGSLVRYDLKKDCFIQLMPSRVGALQRVDGVERSFYQLDPNEVEDITVLKDASATAVFGVRGANGVILVTTKRGSVAKPEINFSYEFNFATPNRLPDFVDGYTYAQALNEALVNDGSPARYNQAELDAFRDQTSPNFYPNVDWMDEALRGAAYGDNVSFSSQRADRQ